MVFTPNHAQPRFSKFSFLSSNTRKNRIATRRILTKFILRRKYRASSIIVFSRFDYYIDNIY